MPTRLRVLITGAAGCAGFYLSLLALEKGAMVTGWDVSDNFAEGVRGIRVDMTDRVAVSRELSRCRPDWIFHLAARLPGEATVNSADFLAVNFLGTRNLLESALKLAPGVGILVAGSSAIYAPSQAGVTALTEAAPLEPSSPYALSKAAQDVLALQYFDEFGLHVVRTRTFNQTGPREPAGLICGTLARQLASIELGLAPPVLNLITLRTRRDFSDVRDVAAAYWLALETGSPGLAYNVCSGRSTSIASIMDILMSYTRLSGVEIRESRPEPLAGEIVDQVGDPSLLEQCSAWSPVIPLHASLLDLLNEWRLRTVRDS